MKMLPVTYPDNYLSGIASLNLPCEEGTGDWHMLGTFDERNTKPIQFLAGRDLIEVLGTEGIEDRSQDADRAGIPRSGIVWASNHARAIADMVVRSVISGRVASHVRLDDWMPEEDQKKRVLYLLDKAKLLPAQRARVRQWVQTQL